jgi:hypothetical protein
LGPPFAQDDSSNFVNDFWDRMLSILDTPFKSRRHR